MRHEIFDKQPLRSKPVPESPRVESDSPLDLGAFGWLPAGRAIMLEVRHRDGLITAYSYAWLESAEFNPSEGITLNFSGKVVKLVGRNLNSEIRPNIRLFEALLRHSVAWIQEVDETMEQESAESDVIIEGVTVSSAEGN